MSRPIFQSIREIVSVIFKKNSQNITLRPNNTTTYTAARTIDLPPQDVDSVIVSEAASQTLTNKTIDITNNTISNISNTNISSSAAIALNKLATNTASKALVSDSSGYITSSTTTASEISALAGKVVIVDGGNNTGSTLNIGNQAAAFVNFLVDNTTKLSIRNSANTVANADVIISGNSGLSIPSSTTGNRPSSPLVGTIRHNSSSGFLELYNALGWHDIINNDSTQTLTNKTLTSPIISSISNTGTLTLPTSSDTLVGRATSDTLTNKTINHQNNIMQGRTSGTSVSSGEIGQIITTSSTPGSSGTDFVIGSISLTAGVWMVRGSVATSSATANNRYTIIMQLSSSGGGFSGATASAGAGNGGYFSTANDSYVSTGFKFYNFSSTTSVYLALAALNTVSVANFYMEAVRIA
jgi:hypothetical protein